MDYFWRLAFLLQAGLPLERVRYELEYRCKDGSTIWCDVYVLPVCTADGIPVELLGMSRDITAVKRAESEAKRSERRLRKMLEHLPVGIAVASLQPDQRILHRNTKFDQTFGWTPEEIPTHDAWFLRAYPDADYRRVVLDQWGAGIARAVAQQGQVTPHEFRVTSRDGTVKDIVISGTVLDDRLICSFVDISERKRFEAELVQARDATETANRALQKANAELQRLAVTDRLTGVGNRAYFEEAVAAEIARAARYGAPLSLLLLDIDHFKAINDTHGHLVGDQVSIELTGRLGQHLREVDVLARWGGEEFVIPMPHCGAIQALHAAEKLRALVADRTFPEVGAVTMSIGVAEYQPHERDNAWIKRVDDALYAAKSGGRNRVCLSTREIR
ncbi:sensor domain-containing diguanylate cyclase [uncultured Thiodictyon sp.]|uniref:sensor domain-containing diguanylate cyclase n=1 Tax=uncultured Thiodictyon sp. TaxID=1846217 RepID=UPI0025F72778|nr:sensor domain-containing diguanylate cyclase [uncultured Thiodictyon sp.]